MSSYEPKYYLLEDRGYYLLFFYNDHDETKSRSVWKQSYKEALESRLVRTYIHVNDFIEEGANIVCEAKTLEELELNLLILKGN